MAQIVAKTSKIRAIYDPAVGSGSLLLTVKKHLAEDVQKDLCYYGQEKNTATYNLTRMNLLLHGIRPEKMEIKNGDTLSQDWPEDPERPNEGVLFDAVVMNPPYSAKNWNRSGLKVSDPRFEAASVLPPDSIGGIPQKNIDDLKILKNLVPDVLADSRIITKSKLIEQSANQYIEKYWNILREINNNTYLTQLMEDMLVKIKADLSEFQDIEVYNGYQIIAEIWIGAIVPNDLIAKRLYGEELKEIEDKKYRAGERDTELSEFVEAAKVEDSVVNTVLYDAIWKGTQ